MRKNEWVRILAYIPYSRQHEVGRCAFRSHHIRAHLHILAPFTTSDVQDI